MAALTGHDAPGHSEQTFAFPFGCIKAMIPSVNR